MIAFDNKWLGLIVATAFSILGIYLASVLGTSGWIVMLLIIGVCLFFGHPRQLLFVYFAWTAVSGLAMQLTDAFVVRWMDEMLSALLLAIVLGTYVTTHRVLSEMRALVILLAALVGLIVLSAVANQVSAMSVFHFVLAYLRFFLVFYVARFYLQRDDAIFFRKCAVVLILFEMVLNVGWLIGFNPVPNARNGTEDFAIGTFQGCDVTAYVAVAVINLGLAYLLTRAATFSDTVRSSSVIAVGLAQAWITYTFHAYLILAVTIGIQLLAGTPTMRARVRPFLFIIPVGVALALFVVGAYPESRERLKEQLSWRGLALRWDGMVNGVKGQAHRDIIINAPRDPEMRFPWIGAGPGNFASTVGRMYRSVLAERYINYVSLSNSSEYWRLSEGGSITGMPYTGVLSMWSELGPFGALIYWCIPVYAVVRVFRAMRRGAYVNADQLVLAQAFVPIGCMWVGLNLMVDLTHSPFLNAGVWIWAAYVWVPEPEPGRPAPQGDGTSEAERV